MNREDFKILDSDLVFFDNGATTLKPKVLMASLTDYYSEYTSNAHRGDYKNSIKTSTMFEDSRNKIASFINAESKEIIFTSGTTDSLNKIVFGFFKNNFSMLSKMNWFLKFMYYDDDDEC